GYQIYPFLQRYFEEHPVIRVNRDCEDVGPLTKLLPVLTKETDPNTRIFPVDDDCHFPPRYFERLLKQSLKSPTTVFGYNGLIAVPGGFRYSSRNWWRTPSDVIETNAGAVYVRHMFGDNFQPPPLSSPCYFTDDVTISSHVAQRGFDRVLLP